MRQENLPGPFHMFTGQDLPHLLEARANDRADHPFLIFAPPDLPAQKWTYRAFRDAVACLAGGLAERGVARGDFVVIHMDNCIEFLLAHLAAAEQPHKQTSGKVEPRQGNAQAGQKEKHPFFHRPDIPLVKNGPCRSAAGARVFLLWCARQGFRVA